MITVTTFKWVPDFARGLVRDMRVRWALEEAGLDYAENLIGFDDREMSAYRRKQPFGQVPVYEDGEVVLFESGGILHHIASRHEALMPHDPAQRAGTTSWIFAALNSLEPYIQNLAEIDLFHAGEDWAKARRPEAEAMVRTRLGELSAQLEGRDWLVAGRFTAADLMMSMVLEILRHTDILAGYPVLKAYRDRCFARPAYARALERHMAVYEGAPEPA
jgi:glutathione S-transferase